MLWAAALATTSCATPEQDATKDGTPAENATPAETEVTWMPPGRPESLTDDRARGSESPAALPSDPLCSPHPWASLWHCSHSRRSTFAGPRTTPRLLTRLRSEANVVASSDGSILTSTLPQALVGTENLAKVSTVGSLTVSVMKAADGTPVRTIRVASSPADGVGVSIQTLTMDKVAVQTGSNLYVVDTLSGGVETCDGCQLSGAYGNELLVSRHYPAIKQSAWWEPATNQLRPLPSPPARPEHKWEALGVLTDRTVVLYLDQITLYETLPDKLAFLAPDGTLSPALEIGSPAGPNVVSLPSGDFIFNGLARVTRRGEVRWSVGSRQGAVSKLELAAWSSLVDGGDTTYTLLQEYDASMPGGDFRSFVQATASNGEVVWTYRDDSLSVTACELGLATSRRLFVYCFDGSVKVLGE